MIGAIRYSEFIYLLAWHKSCIFGGSPNLRHRSLKARVEVLFWARVPTTQACTQVIRYQCFCLVEISISIIGIALVPPGDFVTNVNVKQINSQSELTSMSSFAGPSYLTVRSSLYIILHHFDCEILAFSIAAKLDPVTYVGNVTRVRFVSTNK